MTRCEAAEKILEYACEKENFIKRTDRKFMQTVFESGPSGYVGCSNECRGVGLRRRSGYMLDIAEYLNKLGREKDKAISELKPIVCAFEKMKGTRSGHIIYYRVGKKMGVQEYADKVGISRRHCRRLYIKAMEEFIKYLLEYGGENLVNKFFDIKTNDRNMEENNLNTTNISDANIKDINNKNDTGSEEKLTA